MTAWRVESQDAVSTPNTFFFACNFVSTMYLNPTLSLDCWCLVSAVLNYYMTDHHSAGDIENFFVDSVKEWLKRTVLCPMEFGRWVFVLKFLQFLRSAKMGRAPMQENFSLEPQARFSLSFSPCCFAVNLWGTNKFNQTNGWVFIWFTESQPSDLDQMAMDQSSPLLLIEVSKKQNPHAHCSSPLAFLYHSSLEWVALFKDMNTLV